MIGIVLYGVVALFLLKIVWNILTPYVLGRRLYLTEKDETSRISMAPFVEVFLLVSAILLSSFTTGASWLYSPKNIALAGVSLIALSYIHFVIAGVAIGWLVSRLRKQKERSNDPKDGS